MRDETGQTVTEFMLVLPFFLMVVFTVMLLAFAVIKAEMVTYATFWGARVAEVGGGRAAEVDDDYQQAAQEVLPGIAMSKQKLFGVVYRMNGSYHFNPILGKAGGEDSLNSPLADLNNLETWVPLHLFPKSRPCVILGNDNPIGHDPCYPKEF
ncbi:MAG: pilus assembly protein [Deltaproteobacteria bacterium]|nr:pilus assembly protein [Deltaproteobacteria bacterium]MBI4224190.1 pilus assembly protein [Deltaproteobacteria bacterium]